MRKRERENPCGVCGHYHKYEEGEVCGVCGHRIAAASDASAATVAQVSAFPSEILPEFLYLGSYDNAARAELLKTQGISRVLNTVPACQNLYKNSFTYHCLEYDQHLPFDDAIRFLEQCEKERAKVLVHCMTGKNRSPAVVMAYLMKSKGWKLVQSYQWVKERRPSVELNQGVYQQLQDYEQKISGSSGKIDLAIPNLAAMNFGFSRPNNTSMTCPAFDSSSSDGSFLFRGPFDLLPQEFTFGAGGSPEEKSQDGTSITAPPVLNDVSMDGS